MKTYPNVNRPEELVNFAKDVARKRLEDIANFNNLPNLFISGRKVAKVPTGSADVDPSDRIGDFNYTTSYLYICVDDSGTAAWRRVALGSW